MRQGAKSTERCGPHAVWHRAFFGVETYANTDLQDLGNNENTYVSKILETDNTNKLRSTRWMGVLVGESHQLKTTIAICFCVS